MESYDDGEYGPQHSTPIKPQNFQNFENIPGSRLAPSSFEGLPNTMVLQSNNSRQSPGSIVQSQFDSGCGRTYPSEHPNSIVQLQFDSGCGRSFTTEHTIKSEQLEVRKSSPRQGVQCMGSLNMPSAERLLSPRRAVGKTGSKMRPSSVPRFHLDTNTCNHSNDAQYPSYSFTEFRKVPAAYIEQDIINKQRHEIQLLMEELGTRDQELNDLVLSHQKQVKAWENDCEKLSALQLRITQYEEELRNREEQLKETLDEMSRVNEQRDVDARELERTKDEMMKLAERIMENSLYIQEMEAQNQKLTASLKELVNIQKAFKDREQELMALLDEKDYQLSDKQQELDKLVEHIKFLECRCEEQEDKNANMVAEASTWKKKFCLAKDETDRLTSECFAKEENINKVTQQLHESLQQAIALQKALFTSCEREKCKEEVMYSLRKQHKRTMQELQNIRELYDRQNRDTTLYHLSVKDRDMNHGKKREEDLAEDGKRKKDESRQKHEDERGKAEGKLRHDRNMSFHGLKTGTADVIEKDTSVRFLVKEKKDKKGQFKSEKTEEHIPPENHGQGDGCETLGKASTQIEISSQKTSGTKVSPKIVVREVRNEQLSPIAVKAGHTPMCRNATTITSSTSIFTEENAVPRTRSMCLSRTCVAKQSHMLEGISILVPPPELETMGRNQEEQRPSRSQPECRSSSNLRKSTRSRTTSPIIIREGPLTGKQNKAGQSSSSPIAKRSKDKDQPAKCESSSDVSQLVSPAKYDDDELTPADSDGMCHELKRDISRLGTECSDTLGSLQDIMVLPARIQASSLANPKKSSFLKKEKLDKKITFSACDESTASSTKHSYRKKGGDTEARREQCAESSPVDIGHSEEQNSPTMKQLLLADKNCQSEREISSSKWKSHAGRTSLSPEKDVKGSKFAVESDGPLGGRKAAASAEKESPQARQKEEWRQIGERPSYGYFILNHGPQTSGTETAKVKTEPDKYITNYTQVMPSQLTFKEIERLLEYNSTLSNPNKHSLKVTGGPSSSCETPQYWAAHCDIDPFLIHNTTVKDALAQPTMRIGKKLQFSTPGFDPFLNHWGAIPSAKSTVDSMPEDVSVYLGRQWPLRTKLYFNNNKSVDNHSESEEERPPAGIIEMSLNPHPEGPTGKEAMDLRSTDLSSERHGQVHSDGEGRSSKALSHRGGQRRSGDKKKLNSKPYQNSQSEVIEKGHKDSSSNYHVRSHSEAADIGGPTSSDSSENFDISEQHPSMANLSFPHSFVQSNQSQEHFGWTGEDSQSGCRDNKDGPSSGSGSDIKAGKERPYFYVETVDSSDSSKREQKGEVADVPVIASVPSKPFTSTSGPSLYKHLSQIHFSEKTHRYEWVSQPELAAGDGEKARLHRDKSSNCLSSSQQKSDSKLSDLDQTCCNQSQDSTQDKPKSCNSKGTGHSRTDSQHSDSGHNSGAGGKSVSQSRHRHKTCDDSSGQTQKKPEKEQLDSCLSNEGHHHHHHPPNHRERLSQGVYENVNKSSTDPLNKPKSNSGTPKEIIHSKGGDSLDTASKRHKHSHPNSNSNNNCIPVSQKPAINSSNQPVLQRKPAVNLNIPPNDSCLQSSVLQGPSKSLDAVVKRLDFENMSVEDSRTEFVGKLYPYDSCHIDDRDQTVSDCEMHLKQGLLSQIGNVAGSNDVVNNNGLDKSNTIRIRVRDVGDLVTKLNGEQLMAEEPPMNHLLERLLYSEDTASSVHFTCYLSDLVTNCTAPPHHTKLDKSRNISGNFSPKDCRKLSNNLQEVDLYSEEVRFSVSKGLSGTFDTSGNSPQHCADTDGKEQNTRPADISWDPALDLGKENIFPHFHDSAGPPCSLHEYFKDISTLLVYPDDNEMLAFEEKNSEECLESPEEEESCVSKQPVEEVGHNMNMSQRNTISVTEDTITDKLCQDLLVGQLKSNFWSKAAQNCNKDYPPCNEKNKSSSVIQSGNFGALPAPHDTHVHLSCVPHYNISVHGQSGSVLENTRDSNTSTLSKSPNSSKLISCALADEGSADPFEDKLSSFLEDPAPVIEKETKMLAEPVSPTAKLLRLLVASHEMILSLEHSAAIPEGIRTKVGLSSRH